MRTTIDLPDELYRTLKARAALGGISLRELIQRLIEQGMRSTRAAGPASAGRRDPPPVIVPPRGARIPAVSRADLKRLEEAEDEARHDRFA